MPVFSWLFWRAVPWLLAKLSPVLLICVEFLAGCLLWPEYWLAEYMRKRNRKPPVANYVFGDILGWMVSIADRVTQLLDRWLEFTIAKRWQPRKVECVVAIIALPLVWFVSPAFGKQSAVATLVDRGATWWCSLESWVMTGQWKAERQFCNYPGQSTPISAADKRRIYRFRIELEKSNQTIQSYPRDPRAYANRGNVYLEQGYANEAFKDFTKAILIDPYFAPGHSGRGDVYLMKRDNDVAFKEYTHAIRRAPEYAPGYKG
ncbi:MAG: tetratricopeptide repeat protein [Hormoscilla sp. GM7CHS1pb]|nr:tetratricopeptide repeat protein [Hormoscilla sp. GM7CHS1pb]